VKTGMSLQDFDTHLNKLKIFIAGPKFCNGYGILGVITKPTICWYYNDIVYDGIKYILLCRATPLVIGLVPMMIMVVLNICLKVVM
jgi:hypothetical protein